MESKRVRSKNYTEQEKHLLLDLVTVKYKDVIENKQSDAVTIARKNLAWEEVANQYNSSNQTGPRNAKQLHALYDNLKKSARSNLLSDKQNAYKTGSGTFIPKSGVLEEKISAVLKEQFEPLSNRFDSSSSYLEAIPRPSSLSDTNDNYDIEEIPIIFEDVSTINREESRSPPTTSSKVIPPSSAGQKRKQVQQQEKLLPKKKKRCLDTLTTRFVQRKNFKDEQDEDLKKRRMEILDIEHKIKLKQLAVVEQQYEHQKRMNDMELKYKMEENEFEKKIREIKLNNMLKK